MPILDIQQRLREIGRLRIGAKTTSSNGKERPTKLDTFRVTSPSADLVQAVAEIYGGEPRPWDGGEGAQHEVYTTAAELEIMLPPFEVLDQYYELWAGGGCQRRCDGRTELIGMKPCACPSDPVERAVLAQRGNACKPATRLRVILPQVAGIGVWRLETHSYYAATELAGVAQLLAASTAHGCALPAKLRLEQRQRKVPNQPTKRFAVPVIDVIAPLGLVLESVGAVAEIGPARTELQPGRRATQRLPLPAGAELPADPTFKELPSARPALPEPPPVPAAPEGRPAEPALPPAPPPPTSAPLGITEDLEQEPERGQRDERDRRLVDAAEVTAVAIACRSKAGLDDEGRHDLVWSVTGGRTQSSKELYFGEVEQVFIACDLLAGGHATFDPDPEDDTGSGRILVRADTQARISFPLDVPKTRAWLAKQAKG